MSLPPYIEFERQGASYFIFILEVLFRNIYAQHLLPNSSNIELLHVGHSALTYTGIVGDYHGDQNAAFCSHGLLLLRGETLYMNAK
jgi:hypothetical protein